MTQASICTIGDEILIGQIVDTNSSHISQALNSLGIRVTRMLSIGDEHDTIISALEGDPRPHNIEDDNRIYGFEFSKFEIKFSVKRDILTVLAVEEKN